MACIHLVASNEIKEACGLATDCFYNEQISTPKIKNGMLDLPDKPGLGLKMGF